MTTRRAAVNGRQLFGAGACKVQGGVCILKPPSACLS